MIRGWSDADIPDLRGKVAVVTGANSGLGYRTAEGLARHGARVILACRDPQRGGVAVARLLRDIPGANAELGVLNLSSLAGIRSFAAGFLDSASGLDILVNNAGLMHVPQRFTDDGFEEQFGVNHLGHFALTGLLLPALASRPGARVVTVSSILAGSGRIDFDNLDAGQGYYAYSVYAMSKLANQMFMLELDRRARRAGMSLISAGAHPGWAATNLQARGPKLAGDRLHEFVMAAGNALFAQSDRAGSLPILRAATEPGVSGGSYFGPRLPGGLRGRPVAVATVPLARDAAVAERLWSRSEELTGVTYEFAKADSRLEAARGA